MKKNKQVELEQTPAVANKIMNFQGLVSKSFVFTTIALLLFMAVLGLGKVMPGRIVLLNVCCLLIIQLISFCRNRFIGGMYIILTVIAVNIPAFLIQKNSLKSVAYDHMPNYLQQSSFFIGTFLIFFVSVNVLCWINSKIKNRLLKFFFKSSSFLFLLTPCLFSFCYLSNWALNNPPIDSDAILAVYQTNHAEAWEYFVSYVNYYRLAAVIFLVLLEMVLAYKTVASGFIFSSKNNYFKVLAVSMIIGVFSLCKYHVNMVTEPFYRANYALSEFSAFEKLSNERATLASKIQHQENKGFKGTYVVVIGESLTRNHMSAYGYQLRTTPWQDSIKELRNSVFFNNAFSNHTHTVQVLSFALTQKNQYQNRNMELSSALSIIDIARYAADFNVIWLSNQSKLGVNETPITTIASNSNHQYWLNNDENNYDEVILKQLTELELSDNNLIFIHLMGCHSKYNVRYPKSYALFSNSNDSINSYNNAVLYNDNILQQIYDKVKFMPNFKALLYLSDHGEDVERDLGHNSANFTWDMTKIPFWVLFSDEYLKEHPLIVETLNSHRNSPFTNDLLFDTLLGLMGITGVEQYIPKNDLASEQYSYTTEELVTLHGTESMRFMSIK